jgi:Tol biopolymer transport system component
MLACAVVGCGSNVASRPANLATVRTGSLPSPTRRVAGLAYVTGPGPEVPQVWIAAADATRRHRLGEGNQPLLSPSGTLVAATALQGSHALIIYSSRGPRTMFFTRSVVSARPLAWSPDSRYLAVSVGGYVTTEAGNAAQRAALYVIDDRTGKATRIAIGYPAGASFAPDGPVRLVYGLGRASPITGRLDLYTSNPDGAAVHQLTHNGRSLNPVWSRSGILFNRESEPSMYQIFWRANDGHTSQITDTHLSDQDQGLVPVDASSDGNRFVAVFENFKNWQLWTISVSDKRARELTNPRVAVTNAAISRNGRSILFGTVHKVQELPFSGGRTKVIIMDANQPTCRRR